MDSFAGVPAAGSVCPTAVDQLRGAGRERRLVGREIDREQRDLLGAAEPAHRLAADEGGLDLRERLPARLGLLGDALAQRRRLDGARADRIAADAAGDEI